LRAKKIKNWRALRAGFRKKSKLFWVFYCRQYLLLAILISRHTYFRDCNKKKVITQKHKGRKKITFWLLQQPISLKKFTCSITEILRAPCRRSTTH